MNWFQRHLNWTWVLAYLLWFVINAYANDPFGIAWWFSLVAAIFCLIVSGWVIKQKGRSLWWILLNPFFSPLWLKNKKGYHEPTESAWFEQEQRRRDEERVRFEEEQRRKEEARARFERGSRVKETYYEILGISRNATQDEIKKAYRDKIKEYHPDRFINQPKWIRKEADEMSKKLNEAYEVLSDPNKRKENDRGL